ncbi:MAG: hypothetical protein WA822_15980 [Albidovulum sp.]
MILLITKLQKRREGKQRLPLSGKQGWICCADIDRSSATTDLYMTEWALQFACLVPVERKTCAFTPFHPDLSPHKAALNRPGSYIGCTAGPVLRGASFSREADKRMLLDRRRNRNAILHANFAIQSAIIKILYSQPAYYGAAWTQTPSLICLR